MVNANRASKWDFGGRTYTNRQALNDVRGRIAELLAKAVNKGALDEEMGAGDKEAMRQFLGAYGGLVAARRRLSGRRPRGLFGPPGAYGEAGTAVPPMQLQDMLKQRGDGSCPCCSRRYSTSRRRCSSRSAAWTGSPTRSTSGSGRRCGCAPR